jgi:hypothetical protein
LSRSRLLIKLNVTMETRNKHWRIEQRNRVYVAKMRLYAAYGHVFLNGRVVDNPRWVDLYKARWSPVYLSVRTPRAVVKYVEARGTIARHSRKRRQEYLLRMQKR